MVVDVLLQRVDYIHSGLLLRLSATSVHHQHMMKGVSDFVFFRLSVPLYRSVMSQSAIDPAMILVIVMLVRFFLKNTVRGWYLCKQQQETPSSTTKRCVSFLSFIHQQEIHYPRILFRWSYYYTVAGLFVLAFAHNSEYYHLLFPLGDDDTRCSKWSYSPGIGHSTTNAAGHDYSCYCCFLAHEIVSGKAASAAKRDIRCGLLHDFRVLFAPAIASAVQTNSSKLRSMDRSDITLFSGSISLLA